MEFELELTKVKKPIFCSSGIKTLNFDSHLTTANVCQLSQRLEFVLPDHLHDAYLPQCQSQLRVQFRG